MTRAGDDAERSDAEERRFDTAGDDAERSDAEERRFDTAGDDAERSDAEERRFDTAGDDAERSDAEERRFGTAGDDAERSDAAGAPPACGGRAAPMTSLAGAATEDRATRRYQVTHRTQYRYSDVVTSSYGRGFLTPRDTARQRCVSHELRIDPSPADSSVSRDTYGNLSSYFHITQPHRALTVTSISVVEVDPPPADLYEGRSAYAPWEAARPVGLDGALATEFTLDLNPAEITDEVRGYAAPSFARGCPLIEVLRDLGSRIRTDFSYRSGSTTVSTSVAEVLAARSGVCQDFARLAIACLRANGLSASYVSGYLATDPPPGRERMIGIDATHAWAMVWMPGNQWLGFDPTNNQMVDERYIVVGLGRDYADVPPLRGIIYTNSENSTIDVAVDVEPCEGGVLHA